MYKNRVQSYLGCSSTPNKMIILRYHEVFFRLAAPTAMPAHLGAYSLEKTSWYRNIIILLGVEEHPNRFQEKWKIIHDFWKILPIPNIIWINLLMLYLFIKCIIEMVLEWLGTVIQWISKVFLKTWKVITRTAVAVKNTTRGGSSPRPNSPIPNERTVSIIKETFLFFI